MRPGRSFEDQQIWAERTERDALIALTELLEAGDILRVYRVLDEIKPLMPRRFREAAE